MKVEILGVKLDDLSLSEVVGLICSKIAKGEKFSVVTPNPEFLVAAHRDENFQEILEKADLAIPDGVGLVIIPRLLGFRSCLSQRVAGADVVERLLRIAVEKGWRLGVVGARRSETLGAKELIERLEGKYSGIRIENLEDNKDWPSLKYDVIFACQGMGEQEKWIFENLDKSKGNIFMGIGGSLDFLAEYSMRAPILLRNFGLEWLWRLATRPKTHLVRVYRAFVVFPVLLLKERLRLLFLDSE
ncbi:MAG: WecB/TagA/CpsF family glycosyltransferase [bacterium]|nr:WecB/TagA/CpsF family glycosyltransferase [bacterium]